MKNKINTISKNIVFYKFKLINDGLEKDGLISLKNSKEFLAVLSSYSWKVISLCMRSRQKTTARVRLFWRFGKYLCLMTYRHDSLFTVKYLKAAQLAIQKKIAGQPFSSLREIEPDLPLPRLSKSGLPIIIGTRDRRAICSGSPRVVQLYLSLFGLYRAISAEVKPKLDTITQPFSGSVPFMLSASDWFRNNSKAILSRTMKVPVPYLKVDAPILLEKASPSSSKS
jgi:hypothetical protein